MPPKAPNFNAPSLHGTIHTETVVQFGCVYCLSEGLTAPAEHHVAYMWQGTSMCGKHFHSYVVAAGSAG